MFKTILNKDDLMKFDILVCIDIPCCALYTISYMVSNFQNDIVIHFNMSVIKQIF